jgi:hypothetical protein
LEGFDEYLAEVAGKDYDYLTLNGTDGVDNVSIRKYFIAMINYDSDSNSDGLYDIERINYNETVENIYINTFAGNDISFRMTVVPIYVLKLVQIMTSSR